MDDEIFEQTNELMLAKLVETSEEGNFDFLHGSYGIGFYLLSRKIEYGGVFFDRWFNLLIEKSENFGEILKKKKVLDRVSGINGYCLGLAHGSPATILILIKFLSQSDSSLAREILNKTLNFLLSVRLESPSPSYFPTNIIDGKAEYLSRLAWCYGDLGCAFALYKAGIFLKRDELVAISIETALNAAKIKYPNIFPLNDACLCHGTSGVAHFFARFYNETKNESFQAASEYWYGETIAISNFSKYKAGFRLYNGFRQQYEEKYCLLEGLTGIGLSLLGGISTIEPAWDECLLLS
jgi:lantibiotic modifying enzyme